MRQSECESIVAEAICQKLRVEVEYIRGADGVRTCRIMEPFDVAPGSRSRTNEFKFWGWCLHHNTIEGRTIANIISIRILDQHFDPSIRERSFSSRPRYRIPRNWNVN